MQIITPNYSFSNKYVKQIPPQRDYYYIEYEGISENGTPYRYFFDSISLNELKKDLRNPLEVPKRLGNWDLMNEWITNMWEALYNPINVWGRPDGKNAILKGRHRFRLLDAMGCKNVYFYRLEATTYKTGKLYIPNDIVKIISKNDRQPKKGTMDGICEHCGSYTKWKRVSINAINDVRLYCRICGEENPYPWRGQI